MFTLKKADRSKVKLKVGMWGPSGSGKTMSALRFAKGLVGDWSKIALLDTENGSGELYSHLGEYLHCDFKPPFHPNRYVQAIEYIKNNSDIECLVIDSISHEWDGEGGCLQLHEAAGGKFQSWSKVTPLHKRFIDAILQAPFHIIVTARTKIDYSIDRDEKNKVKVEKVGLKTITREGMDYEMTLAFNVNVQHRALTDKDRTGLFNTEIPFQITEEHGQLVRDWNDKVKEAPVNYKEKFLELGFKLAQKDKQRWAYLQHETKYVKESTDNNEWKSWYEELQKITEQEVTDGVES